MQGCEGFVILHVRKHKYYSANTIFDFGVYQGEVLSEVYKYDPSYIGFFCIDKVDWFILNMTSIQDLPYPTPFNSNKRTMDSIFSIYNIFFKEGLYKAKGDNFFSFEELRDKATLYAETEFEKLFQISWKKREFNLEFVRKMISHGYVLEEKPFNFSEEMILKNQSKAKNAF